MHPTMMITLARQVDRQRQNERRQIELRSQALAERDRGPRAGRRASGLAQRLILGISLRPRLS